MSTALVDVHAKGTPVGSTSMLASARNWPKLSCLYAHDDVAGGRRRLPEGWVRNSQSPTLGSSYGAGFWTNARPRLEAAGRSQGGVLCDGFCASGDMDQRIYVMPSADLVIVRHGVTHRGGFDIRGDIGLIFEVLAGLPPTPAPACPSP